MLLDEVEDALHELRREHRPLGDNPPEIRKPIHSEYYGKSNTVFSKVKLGPQWSLSCELTGEKMPPLNLSP